MLKKNYNFQVDGRSWGTMGKRTGSILKIVVHDPKAILWSDGVRYQDSNRLRNRKEVPMRTFTKFHYKTVEKRSHNYGWILGGQLLRMFIILGKGPECSICYGKKETIYEGGTQFVRSIRLG